MEKRNGEYRKGQLSNNSTVLRQNDFILGQSVSGGETPKRPHENHANPLRSVKFPNFRSLRVVEGDSIRWRKARAVRLAKGASFSLTGDTHNPSSLLSTTTLRISPYCVSLPRFLSPVLPSSYFTSILSCSSARSPSFPRSSHWQLSYAPFRFGSSVFHLSRPQRLPSLALHLCSTLPRGC